MNTDQPEHDCDQCFEESLVTEDLSTIKTGHGKRPKKTKERCPKCRLWICDDCFDRDHIFCTGPDDVWLGELRILAVARSKESQEFKRRLPRRLTER